MTQRIATPTCLFNAQPFSGEGWSVYADVGATVPYRHQRLVGGGRRRRRTGYIKGAGGNHDIATSVPKTARVASGSGSPINVAIPAAWASQNVVWDVRHYKDHVENLTDNFRTATTTLDSNRDDASGIFGTATLLAVERRAGGICRIRLRYRSSLNGVQATVARATATAGPTSPSDATVTIRDRQRIIEIDTPALDDSAPYTYSVIVENAAGTVTKTVLSGIVVQAAGTGPIAPTGGTAAAW